MLFVCNWLDIQTSIIWLVHTCDSSTRNRNVWTDYLQTAVMISKELRRRSLRTAQTNVSAMFHNRQTFHTVVPKSYQREGQPPTLRTSSRTIGEEGLKLKPYHNPNPNTNTKPQKETEHRSLEKERKKIWEPSLFELQNSQNPPFRVWQPNQLCQITIRCKLHNFLAFYSTTQVYSTS